MKGFCVVCNNEPSIVGVTNQDHRVGEKCFSNLIDKNVSWDPETARSDLIKAARSRYPKEIVENVQVDS